MTLPLVPSARDGTADAVVADLLEELAGRLQAGEALDVEACIRDHPQYAERLRRLLPAVRALAEMGGGASAPGLEAPSVVLGDFRIVREVGRGGMGVVYEAEQVSLGRRVALKVLPLTAVLDPRQLRRFENEAHAAASLQHPNIVPVHAVGCDRGVHYYAMQFIDGRTLATLVQELREQPTGGTTLPVLSSAHVPVPDSVSAARTIPYRAFAATRRDERAKATDAPGAGSDTLPTGRPVKDPAFFRTAARMGLQAASALDYAHQQGVVHRDIKPGNLMVEDEPGASAPGVRLWVTDFGVAHCQGQPGLTMTGDLIGTLRYMSPEQALGQRPVVDHRTDVYSLGATLYELLTLRPPFGAEDRHALLRQIAFEEPAAVRRLNRAAPADLEIIVAKAMAKDAEERYATAGELADDLQRFLDDLPILARRPTLRQRARKWARRHRPVVGGLLVATVMLLVGACVGFWLQSKEWKAVAAKEKTVAAQRNQSLREVHLGRATDKRLAREPGYRRQVWGELREAASRGAPGQDAAAIRAEVVACLADPIGLEPIANPDVARRTLVVPEHFKKLLRENHWSSLPHTVTEDGKLLAVLSQGEVTLWGKDGKSRGEIRRQPFGWLGDVEFTPDGHLLVGGGDEGVFVWDVASLRVRSFFRTGNIHSVAVHPSGQLFATAGRQLELLSLASNLRVASFALPKGRQDPKVEFSADGSLLLAVVAGKAVAGWHVSDTPEKRSLFGHSAAVPAVAFSPDGLRVASGSKDRTVRLWDAVSGRLLHTCRGHKDGVESVVFSPDGTLLATGAWDGVVRLWDARSGQPLTQLEGAAQPTAQIWRLQFAPSGRYLVAAGQGGIAGWVVRRTRGRVELEPLFALSVLNGASDVVVHPRESELVFLDKSGRLYAYDLKTSSARPLRATAQLVVRTLYFDPAGAVLTHVTRSDTLGLLDWAKGTTQDTGLSAQHLALGAAGRWAASCSKAQQVLVHDLRQRQELYALPAEGGEVWSLAWSPDGNRLAVGLADGRLSVWDLQQVRARLKEFDIDVPSTAGSAAPTAVPPVADLKALVHVSQTELQAEQIEASAQQAFAQGDPSEARARLSQAVRVRASLVDQSPHAREHRSRLAQAYYHLADSDSQLRDNEASAAHLHQAIALWKTLAAEVPGDGTSRDWLVNAYQSLAAIAHYAGNNREASSAVRRSLEIAQALVADFPKVPGYRAHLAHVYNDLALILKADGKRDQAERTLRKALSVYAAVEADSPPTAHEIPFRQAEARCWMNLGSLLERAGKAALAEEAYGRALALRKGLTEEFSYCPFCHNDFVITLLQLGRHAEAARTARAWAMPPEDSGPNLWQAARFLARCVALAAEDTRLPQQKRRSLVQAYADQALDLLRAAVYRSYGTADLLEDDSDFAPLRSRPDFKQLLTKLHAQAAAKPSR